MHPLAHGRFKLFHNKGSATNTTHSESTDEELEERSWQLERDGRDRRDDGLRRQLARREAG